jgi:hypothetical protein
MVRVNDLELVSTPSPCTTAFGRGEGGSAIGYVRQELLAPSIFHRLAEVNAHAPLAQRIANQRRHRETGEKPDQRFGSESLRPLPALIADYRDSTDALVHKDLRLA